MTRIPGVRGAGTVTVLLALLGALGAASGSANDASPPTVEPDYASGPFADRLCGGGSGDVVCVATRTVAAMVQGSELRADVVADGATCEIQSGLWVCFGINSILAQRGGTTYGDTFLTSREAQPLDPGLLAHESEHVRQWRLFGPDFALMYLLAGTDACTNYFEVTADLDGGGYTCS